MGKVIYKHARGGGEYNMMVVGVCVYCTPGALKGVNAAKCRDQAFAQKVQICRKFFLASANEKKFRRVREKIFFARIILLFFSFLFA